MTFFDLRLLLSSLLILIAVAHYRRLPITQAEINLKDFAGTWEQQVTAGANEKVAVSLRITVSGNELKMVKKAKVADNLPTETLNYYIDGRGESNPDSDKEGTRRSVTRWLDGKLVVKYVTQLSTARSSTDSYEEWSIGLDGKILTQTIVSSGTPLADGTKGAIGRRGSISAPRQTTETRIFKRVVN